MLILRLICEQNMSKESGCNVLERLKQKVNVTAKH
jgi:hypothetical protein